MKCEIFIFDLLYLLKYMDMSAAYKTNVWQKSMNIDQERDRITKDSLDKRHIQLKRFQIHKDMKKLQQLNKEDTCYKNGHINNS